LKNIYLFKKIIFFIKTIYSVILSILCVLFNFPFPFLPIQITLIDLAVEAFPAFLTILEPNIAPIKGKFLPSVFQKALPNAVAILIVIFMIQFTNPFSDSELVETMMYFCVAIISMQAVIRSCIPFTRLRVCICSVMVVGFILAVFLFPNILHIPTLSFDFFKKTLLVSTIGILISISISMIIEFFSKKEPKQKQDRVYLTR
ncbi:MAG: ATPase, partial [Longicatena sp.]